MSPGPGAYETGAKQSNQYLSFTKDIRNRNMKERTPGPGDY
jgi:hypothetical protein